MQRVKREQERGICDRTTIQNTRTAAATNYQKQKKVKNRIDVTKRQENKRRRIRMSVTIR